MVAPRRGYNLSPGMADLSPTQRHEREPREAESALATGVPTEPAAGPDPRRLLLPVLWLGVVGTGLELSLLEHWEDWKQWTPFVVLGVAVISLALVSITRSRPAVRALQVSMLALAGAGLAGIYLHFMSNVEFELEMYPGRGGGELVMESLKGAMPALAPGTLVFMALVGLVFSFRYPLPAAPPRLGGLFQEGSDES